MTTTDRINALITATAQTRQALATQTRQTTASANNIQLASALVRWHLTGGIR